MLGLIYKDWCLLKKEILCYGIVALLFILMSACIPYHAIPLMATTGLDILFATMIIAMVPLCTMGVSVSLVFIDEKRKLSDFIMSSPMGHEQLILSKYLLTLAVCWMPVVLHYFGELIGLFIPGTVSGLIGVTVNAFYGVILYQALEFPFDFRFGSKYGIRYKLCVILLLFYVLMIYLMFGQVPDSNDIIDSLISLVKGEIQMPKFVKYMGVFLPYVSMGAYYISYKISCKVYFKGVERYEA